MSPRSQEMARPILWAALSSHEFIGEENYIWALRVLFESTVARRDAFEIARDLHCLARVMEPIGQREMGTWLRRTLRAEIPGHSFGDAHDRLNY
jgi:hypothetical protein